MNAITISYRFIFQNQNIYIRPSSTPHSLISTKHHFNINNGIQIHLFAVKSSFIENSHPTHPPSNLHRQSTTMKIGVRDGGKNTDR